MTIIGAVFGAVGTAGQRCTSTRRLIIHESIYDKVKDALVAAYNQLKIGDPLDTNNHVGPLIDKDAVEMYLDRKSTRLNSSHVAISYAVFCLKQKNNKYI